jgi:hypothetical protein
LQGFKFKSMTDLLLLCAIALPQAAILELAYAACLLEEQRSWGAAPSNSNAQQLSLRVSTPRSRTSSTGMSSSGSSASSASSSRLSDEALGVMAEMLAQQVLQPQDLAAAATAQLQVRCHFASQLL